MKNALLAQLVSLIFLTLTFVPGLENVIILHIIFQFAALWLTYLEGSKT